MHKCMLHGMGHYRPRMWWSRDHVLRGESLRATHGWSMVGDNGEHHSLYARQGTVWTAGGEMLLCMGAPSIETPLRRDVYRNRSGSMDHQTVLEKAVKLGCNVERDTNKILITTPAGARLTTSLNSRDRMAGTALASQLKRAGVDVKRGVEYGAVTRVDEATLFCKERRCATLECPRNWLAIDFKRGPKEKEINWTSFRTNSCGYKPIKGCTGVVWCTDPETGKAAPRLCELGMHESGEHAVTKETAAQPVQAPEFLKQHPAAAKAIEAPASKAGADITRPAPAPTRPHYKQAGETAREHADRTIPLEKKREAVALLIAGESAESVAFAYGTRDWIVKAWGRDPELGGVQRRQYRTKAFKREAVKRVLAGERAIDVAADMGLEKSNLSGWLRDPELGGHEDYNARGPQPTNGLNGHSAHAKPHREEIAAPDLDMDKIARGLGAERQGPLAAASGAFAAAQAADEAKRRERQREQERQRKLADETPDEDYTPPPTSKPKRQIKFCVFCGTDVAELLTIGIRFCPDCGHSFAGVL